MASKTNTIKTTLTLDGEREYTAALKASKQELKVMGSELKAASAEYQYAGDKMEYLRKRTDILNREIAEQEKIIRSTAEMYEKAAAGGDQFASRANRLKIQLNDAQASLYRMRRELQSTDRELEELGRDSVAAGRDLERGITDGAEDAVRELQRLARESNDSIKDISLMGKVSLVGDMIGTAKDFATATYAWVDSTREYNIAVGKLKANTSVSGADWKAVEEEFLQVTALTGDAATTVTGLNALLSAGYTDAKVLDEMTTLLSGATIKFNNLSFEGLASSIQETLSTGQAAGEFQELITRMGGNVEDINAGLAAGQLEATDLYYLIAELDKDGELKKLLEEFYKGNEDAMAFAEAQTKLNHQLNTLGGHIGDWISPAVTWLAEYTASINEAIEAGSGLGDALTKPAKDALTNEVQSAYGIKPASAYGIVDEFVARSSVDLVQIKEKRDKAQQELLRYINENLVWGQAGGWYTEMLFGDETAVDMAPITEEITEQLDDYAENAKSEGEKLGDSIGTGMETGITPHVDAIQRKIDTTLRELERLSRPATPTNSPGGGSSQTMVINIDGKKLGQALLPYTDAALGTSWQAQTTVKG